MKYKFDTDDTQAIYWALEDDSRKAWIELEIENDKLVSITTHSGEFDLTRQRYKKDIKASI